MALETLIEPRTEPFTELEGERQLKMSAGAGAKNVLKDNHGRIIRKLRVSLLDACNFRCFYCMPKGIKFASSESYLSPDEIYAICKDMVDSGIEQIRVTGGEPTLRQDFPEIMRRLAELKIKKLGLTSNAFLLAQHLPMLQELNCHHINISLDSLQPEKFNRMTHSKTFETVYATILKARDMGFKVKVNTVLIGGWNDDELLDFVAFSEDEGIEVRFLELMRIGQALQYQDSRFMAAADVIHTLSEQTELRPLTVDFDSTSFNFTTPAGGNIGFIASESQPFCDSCSRLRLSYDGHLRACLMLSDGHSIRHLSAEERLDTVHAVMGLKPITRVKEVHQDMYQIGG